MSEVQDGAGSAPAARKPSRKEARQYALQAIYQWQIAGTSRGDLLAQYRSEPGMIKCDSVYFADLVEGVLTHEESLEESFVSVVDRPVDQLDPIERATLLIGAYELRDHPEIPYRVVINEAVELAKRYGATESHKYINGVMDRLARKLREVEIKAGL